VSVFLSEQNFRRHQKGSTEPTVRSLVVIQMPGIAKVCNFDNKLFSIQVDLIPWNFTSTVPIWEVDKQVI
jgi:hypothetical protein